MKSLPKIITLLAGLLLSAGVMATPMSSLLGDKDCFGTNGVCTEGVWLPGGWSISSTASDPVFTDRLMATSATTSWTHSVTAGSYGLATLVFRTAGIADIAGPYTVYVDGVAVGAMPIDGYGHIEVQTFSFDFDGALLADGLATVSFTTSGGDAWAVDYSEVLYGAAEVPEPASLAIVSLGLLGLGMSRRKRSA